MSELDRRVAIEVMGEEKPPPPPEDALCRGMGVITDGTISPGRNWEAFCVYENGDIPEWYPVPFSTSLEHALRALDEHFSDADEVKLHMDRVKNSQRTVYVAYASETRGGRTRIHSPAGLGVELAEAICHHVLALKEEE